MGLAFLCWSQALRLAQNTSRVSNLIFLSPFLSLILIHFILGEPIYSTTYLGLIVIVAGLLLQKSGVVTSGKVDVSST
jgi:drug/metabolite transporter (DMT)-like permease